LYQFLEKEGQKKRPYNMEIKNIKRQAKRRKEGEAQKSREKN